MTGEGVAAAALRLVGVPFRLHGRDPRIGLDCLGVVALAYGQTARMPNHYGLRSRSLSPADPIVAAVTESMGLFPVEGSAVPGDLLMLRPGPCQVHFALAVGPDRIVHAHAGLRRVVLGPVPQDWPLIGRWRPLNPQEKTWPRSFSTP